MNICESDKSKRQPRAAAHIRHHGLFIDTSFKKNGPVDYYVVEGGRGRFYHLEDAKKVAAHRAAAYLIRKAE
jgi:hypothetical protein